MAVVAPPSIRLWILKRNALLPSPKLCACCTPFDPLVDTETDALALRWFNEKVVAPPSIRLWILKPCRRGIIQVWRFCCTPFDPLVDTETF